MGEICLPARFSAARPAVRLGLGLISGLAVLAGLALGMANAGAQVLDDCYADREAVENFINATPQAWSEFTCTGGKATELVMGRVDGPLPPEIGGLTNLTALSLDDAFVTAIPPEIGNLTSLTRLNLHENTVSEIPAEIGKLSNLTYLDLSENPISSLPDEFANLTNLTYLELRNGELTQFPPGIENFTKLTELHLDSNKITTVPPEIKNLSNLKRLDLYDNSLTDLPATFGDIPALEELGLTGNDFGLFPRAIGSVKTLTSLGVGDCGLKSLSPEIGNLTALRYLGLSDNELTTLPPEIGKLTNLESLNARYNNLTTLPPEIGELGKLEELDLLNNSFTSMPPEIGKLTAMTRLWLQNSSLTELPAELGELANLEDLRLTNNDLTTLPSTVGGLSNLKRLYADSNDLRYLPPEIGSLRKLEVLGLDNNKLRTLPPEIGNLAALQFMPLDHNELASLPVEMGQLATKRFPFSFGSGHSIYDESGLDFPYVAIGACESEAPEVLAIAAPDTAPSDAANIIVDGVAYPLTLNNRSELATATLDGAGGGPTFTVTFSGTTQKVDCQDKSGSGPSGDEILDREVMLARSCLAGRGRVDFNIVNTQGEARYRIEFQGLTPRERSVSAKQAWRMPFTGRPDGDYEVTVTKTLLEDNTTAEITRTFAVDCKAESPKELSEEFQVVSYCAGGDGFIRYQFVNPTKTKRSYIIGLEGLPDNRSTTAQPFGASISGISGRPDGTYATTIEYGDQRRVPVHSQMVTVNCDGTEAP